MKLTEALASATRLFLDTAPVIYYIERHPQYGRMVDEIFDRVDTEQIQAVTSPVTLAECLVVPCRLGQESVEQDFVDLIVNGRGVMFVPADNTIARLAASLRASYNLSLTDALQVATAINAGCDALLTNDAGLKRVLELTVLVVDELEL